MRLLPTSYPFYIDQMIWKSFSRGSMCDARFFRGDALGLTCPITGTTSHQWLFKLIKMKLNVKLSFSDT